MREAIHPRDVYRLPWTLNDNVLGWLEPTKRCNLYCEGCYSDNVANSDKALDHVRRDIEAFVAQRTMDSISIAGGDPLIYPHIVEVVRMITEDFGLKAIINTNALALTEELLLQLRDAGLYGFTFHIDSSQGRPHWKNKTEVELNELRLHYAQMVAKAGDMSVAFNCTVFPHTLESVPSLLRWAGKHIDIVHSMVFILFRTTRTDEFQYFRNGEKVGVDELVYYDQDQNPEPLVAQDVIDQIRTVDEDYAPCGYLGSTKDPNAFKWLLATRLGTKTKVFGYAGSKYMELLQSASHATRGRYLGYVRPTMLSHGRSMMATFSSIDPELRKAAANYARYAMRHPLEKVHLQSLLIIQPIDMMPDGEMGMCDGCPDMTVHNGELVWSCRLDERQKHGCFLTAAPLNPQS